MTPIRVSLGHTVFCFPYRVLFVYLRVKSLLSNTRIKVQSLFLKRGLHLSNCPIIPRKKAFKLRKVNNQFLELRSALLDHQTTNTVRHKISNASALESSLRFENKDQGSISVFNNEVCIYLTVPLFLGKLIFKLRKANNQFLELRSTLLDHQTANTVRHKIINAPVLESSLCFENKDRGSISVFKTRFALG